MVTFSFTPLKKRGAKRITAPKTTVVIDNNVMAVIWIDIKGVFTANTEHGDICVIDRKCYSCKGVKNIYRLASHEPHGLRYIRLDSELTETNNKFWLPFGPGSMVIGKVTENVITHIKTFTINKIFHNMKNAHSRAAAGFYIENKEIIDKILRDRQNGIN